MILKVIFGATAIGCGNYQDMNLTIVKHYANRYLNEVLYNINDERLIYLANFILINTTITSFA